MTPFPRLSGQAVLTDAERTLTGDELAERVARVVSALLDITPEVRVLGLQADNGFDWIVADLAAQEARITLVPLPAFFTPAQCEHAIKVSQMDAIFTMAPAAAEALGFADATRLPGISLLILRRKRHRTAHFPAGTVKITFTSGTTGDAKGVCLDDRTQWRVAESLVEALAGVQIERHLCLLPLAVLLENVAGVYTPLLRRTVCCVPSLRDVGMTGASGFDAKACLAAIKRYDAQSVILLPQMLAALTEALDEGAEKPSSLRFAAVGGAKVSASLLDRARARGVPVYEGYGLSECSSVVALNVPGGDRPGSVGRPLSNARVTIASNGEILVRGQAMLGYTGDRESRDEASAICTGDLGRIDTDGFLHINGRLKQQLITSFGRNVAPEWPEAELMAGGAIAQAVVFGEARPALCAVIVPRSTQITDAIVAADIAAANQRLPDYARIAGWIRADTPFLAGNGLATANGRPRREQISARYQDRIDRLYALDKGGCSAVL